MKIIATLLALLALPALGSSFGVPAMSAASISIGNTVGGGTPRYTLFTDPNGKLANAPAFQLDSVPSAVSGADFNTTGHTFTSAYGLSLTSVACDPPMTFNGASGTGFAWHPITGYPEQLFTCINGRQAATTYYQTAGDSYSTIFAVDVVRGDIAASPHGHVQNGPWSLTISYGGYVFGNGSAGGEIPVLLSNNTTEGVYFNTTTGGYMGLVLFDTNVSTVHRMNIQSTATGWTNSFTDNTAANSVNGFDYTLQAQNKTAGTGAGGNVILLAGTSSGGAQGQVIIPKTFTPASSSAACTTGTVAWDSSFIYTCIATNTWKRAAVTTW